MARKREIERPYAPDYVSIETLAYRLDYSRSTIDDYVRRGLLPKPLTVGTGPRWRWVDVEAWILSRNGAPMDNSAASGFAEGEGSDPYRAGIEGLKRAEATNA